MNEPENIQPEEEFDAREYLLSESYESVLAEFDFVQSGRDFVRMARPMREYGKILARIVPWHSGQPHRVRITPVFTQLDICRGDKYCRSSDMLRRYLAELTAILDDPVNLVENPLMIRRRMEEFDSKWAHIYEALGDSEPGPDIPDENQAPEEEEEFDPREYMLSGAQSQDRIEWVKRKLRNHQEGSEYHIPNTETGYGAGFDSQANHSYFEDKYSFLNERGSICGFDVWTLEHPDRHSGLEPEYFDAYLNKIDDDDWESFVEDVTYVRTEQCIDEDKEMDLRSAAENEWWKDNSRDFVKQLRRQPWAQQDPYMSYFIGTLDYGDLSALAGLHEMYLEDQGDGTVWIDLEEVAKHIEASDFEDFNTYGEDREAWQQQQMNTSNSPGGPLDMFDRELKQAVAGKPELEAKYQRMDTAELTRFFFDLINNPPESAGDDYMRWEWVRDRWDSEDHWVLMYPTDHWGAMTGSDQQDHIVGSMQSFVDDHALPALARWRSVPKEHPEFKFEALEEPPGDEEEFDPRDYMMNPADTGEVVKDSAAFTVIKPTRETVDRYVADQKYGSSSFYDYGDVYMIYPKQGDTKFLIAISSKGAISAPPSNHKATIEAYLRQTPYSKELRRFLGRIAKEYIRDNAEEVGIRMLSQIYGTKSVLRYVDRFEMPDDLRVGMGIDAATLGELDTAATLLNYPKELMTETGVTLLLSGEGELADFYVRRDKDSAQNVLDGEPVECDWAYSQSDPADAVEYISEANFKLIREVLPYRTIDPYDDGQLLQLTPQNLPEFDDDDIGNWIKDHKNCDPNGELSDIRDALKSAMADCWQEVATNDYYTGYKETVLDTLDASLDGWTTNGKGRDQLKMSFSWKTLKSWLDEKEGNDTVNDLSELIWNFHPEVTASEDYSRHSWDDCDTLDDKLGEALSQLEAPPYPYDPNQLLMPEIMGEDPNEDVEATIYGQSTPHGYKSRMKRKYLDQWKKETPWRYDQDLWRKHAAETGFEIPPPPTVGESMASILTEQAYKYSSTQLDVPAQQADFIYEWGRLNIPDDMLHQPDPDDNPREIHQHVTVLWGLTVSSVPHELVEICQEYKPFPVYIGKVSLFKQAEYDVVKLDVESPWLRKLHDEIAAALPHESTYPDYKPHCTVAYVKKGSCDKLDGVDIFQNGKQTGMEPQFIAYGIKFKGAGEEGSTRTEETVLFSRVKKPVPSRPAESGPFAGLPFPLDPESTRHFLMGRHRKAAQPIL